MNSAPEVFIEGFKAGWLRACVFYVDIDAEFPEHDCSKQLQIRLKEYATGNTQDAQQTPNNHAGRLAAEEWFSKQRSHKTREDAVKELAAIIGRRYESESRAATAGESPKLGDHDCEYDSDGAPCNHCGLTAAQAIRYFERNLHRKEPKFAMDAPQAFDSRKP